MKTSLSSRAIAIAALATIGSATAQAQSFELTSPDIAASQSIASQYVFNGLAAPVAIYPPRWAGKTHPLAHKATP